MSKVKIIDKKSEKSVKYERELLSHLKHPFIVNMNYAFQDFENLYLVMDLLTGGDLRYHICCHKKFDEEQVRFFLSNIIIGLEYIHSKNILHRDIKPENLVLDNKGYIRITDFGIAKLYNSKNSHETSGTPGYMSPEVMKGQNHTKAVDYFALGVIGYELSMGKRPYKGKSRKEIKEQMMAKQIYIKLEEKPNHWSDEAIDFINKLLIRKPEKRLGYKGINEIKNHPWLKYYPWEELVQKKLNSPYLPENKENYDKKYCNNMEIVGIETKQRYEEYKTKENYENIFLNFTYYPLFDEELNKDYKNILNKNKKINSNQKNDTSNETKNQKINNTIINKKSILEQYKYRCQSAIVNSFKMTHNIEKNNNTLTNDFKNNNFFDNKKNINLTPINLDNNFKCILNKKNTLVNKKIIRNANSESKQNKNKSNNTINSKRIKNIRVLTPKNNINYFENKNNKKSIIINNIQSFIKKNNPIHKIINNFKIKNQSSEKNKNINNNNNNNKILKTNANEIVLRNNSNLLNIIDENEICLGKNNIHNFNNKTVTPRNKYVNKNEIINLDINKINENNKNKNSNNKKNIKNKLPTPHNEFLIKNENNKIFHKNTINSCTSTGNNSSMTNVNKDVANNYNTLSIKK